MSVLITIVAFLVVLGILVIVHEFGHFITARAFKVKVEEFGIGLPSKRLLSFKRGETIYSINALPLGGFVKMAGEEDPKVEGSLASKRVGPRILVLCAGSLMNIILPFVLMAVAFMIPHDISVGQVVVADVYPNSPAALAGIVPGDTILQANGDSIRNTNDWSRNIVLSMGKEMSVLVEHSDSTTQTVELVPRANPPEGQSASGIKPTMANSTVIKESIPLWEAVPQGAGAVKDDVIIYGDGIVSMITGKAPVQFTGPVGIAEIVGQTAQAGISPLLEVAAILSMALAFTNIFPFPALDGGRVVFVLIEWIRRGKRISPKTEGLIHQIGFLILMALMLVITYQDIVRFASGG
jgi:regulator of sigma E protease